MPPYDPNSNDPSPTTKKVLTAAAIVAVLLFVWATINFVLAANSDSASPQYPHRINSVQATKSVSRTINVSSGTAITEVQYSVTRCVGSPTRGDFWGGLSATSAICIADSVVEINTDFVGGVTSSSSSFSSRFSQRISTNFAESMLTRIDG